jgi:ABC-2 type transport system ATP-binding protein
MRRTEVTARFTGPAPDLSDVPGVGGVTRDGATASFFLNGPPAPALRALAAADVTALTVREPSLEEIFLDYYGEAAR